MKNILLLSFVPLLVGCASFEKQHSRAVQFFNANEKQAAEYCSTRFPSEGRYIPGEPVVTIDTTYIEVPYRVDCDSLINANKGKDQRNIFDGKKKVPCENKTERVTDTIIKPDKARERYLQLHIDEYNKKYLEANAQAELYKKEAKKYKLYTAILGLIIISFLGFKLFRR